MSPVTIAESQWDDYRPFIEEVYLTNNKSVVVAIQELERQYNLTTTERRLKLKFDTWKWDKKISAIKYAAMLRIIQHVGQKVVFTVPKMGGRTLWRVDTTMVTKEIKRKTTNSEQRGQPPPQTLDLDTAYDVMREHGITYELQQTGRTRPLRAVKNTQPLPTWSMTMVMPTQSSTNRHENETHDDNYDDVDVDNFTISDHSMPNIDTIQVMPDTGVTQDSSRELNLENFPPELRLRQRYETSHRPGDLDQRRLVGVVPFTAAYLADLHCNIFPHIPEYRLPDPHIAIAHYHDGTHDVFPDTGFYPNDYSNNFELNFCSELPVSQRILREELIAQKLTEYYQFHDHDGHRKMALEFSAYYVAQVVAGYEVPDDYNHVDRNEARNKLRTMLSHNNMQLLTHCYWVSSTLMSHDKVRQVLAFLEDCIDCIEPSTSYLGCVLRPWIRLMVLEQREHYSHYAVQSPRLSPAALEQLNTTFNAVQSLEESMHCLDQHGYGETHTYLILHVYYAWKRCHLGDLIGGLHELVGCSSAAERMFGTRHLVTINCIVMVANGYEKHGDPIFANITVDFALLRLEPISKMMSSKFHQVQVHSARFLLAQGRLPEAREKLERVVQYRRKHFGVQAPATWDAAEMLFDTMDRQGFGLEAQQRRTELRACYEEEWPRHPMRHIP